MTNDRHRESGYLPGGPEIPVSARSNPRCLEVCTQLKDHLHVRVPGRRSGGSKWMGTSPHWILISFSFRGFSKRTKPFKHKSFLVLLDKVGGRP